MDKIKIGDIFVSSWGYDQTNIDYYQVIDRTKKMISLKMIQKNLTPETKMGSSTEPKKNCFFEITHPYNETLKRKILYGYKNQPMIKITSCQYAYPWDGKKRTETYTG